MSITYNNNDDDLLKYVDLGTTIMINRSYTLIWFILVLW